MKNIIRITVIVLAAVLVATVTWFAGYNAGTSQTARFGDEGPRGDFDFEGGEGFPDGDRAGFAEGGRGRGGDHDGGGFSFFGLASFARTLIPITLVIAGVRLAQNLISRWQRGRANKTTTIPPDSSLHPEPPPPTSA